MARRVQAIPDFIQANGAPDMVVLSSTLWDLARLHDHTNHTLSGMLAPDVLKDWIDSLHGIMDLIEVPLLAPFLARLSHSVRAL